MKLALTLDVKAVWWLLLLGAPRYWVLLLWEGQCCSEIYMLPSPSLYCSLHNRPINQETSCWGKKERLNSESHQLERIVGLGSKNHLPEEESRLILYIKGNSVVGCCKLLVPVSFCSVSCPHRSGHRVLINLQQRQNVTFSPCNFLPLYEWRCYTFNGLWALRMETKVFSYPKTCNRVVWMLVPCYVWPEGILLL